MKKFSIKTRITLWYTGLLMIFLYLGVLGSYNAMYDILTNQHRIGMQKGAQMLTERLEKTNPGEEFMLFDRRPLPKDVNFIFFDNDNQIKIGQYQDWMIDLPKQIDEMRTAEHDNQQFFYYDNIIYKNGKPLGWSRTLIEMTSTVELLKEMRERGIIFIFPSLLLSALGGFFLTRWALKPIKNIAKTAKEIGDGNLTKRIELDTAKDEIGELLTEFNHMADNVQQVIEREKQFSADASHEIRTPIAVIITNAEYAIASQDLAVCTQTLELIINKSQQMQQMLSQLMVLARGHEQAEAMELELLDVGSVISDIAEERSAKAKEKNITLKVEAEPNIMVNADLMLLSRMITNLIDNAVQYSRENGYIQLSSYIDQTTKTAVILVVDDGIGIAESDLPFIFNRFYRADKSRSQAGAGLGLSFVEFIVKLHKGKISVDSQLGKGTCFKIELPLGEE